MAENSTDEYTYKQEITKSDLDKYSGLNISEETYNKILWILHNSYVPTNSTNIYQEESYKLLMKNANIEIYSDNTYNLNGEDILTAQRLAIWHYTNGFNAIRSIEGVPSNDLKGQYGEVVTKSRKNKLIDLYNYFVNNASSEYKWEEPKIQLIQNSVKVEETNEGYIVGPYSLTSQNMSDIKTINVTCDNQYSLLDSSKNYVSNNDFTQVINKDQFYLKFNKTEMNENPEIEIKIKYKYDEKTIIFMTNTSEASSTQPVVNVISEEVENETKINVSITLTEISVEKIWNDNNNQDNVRPTNVKMQLYKNGATYGGSIALNQTNNWEYTWEKLLSGYTYTVKELNSLNEPVNDNGKYNDDYTTTYSEDTFTITNTHIPETLNILGTKTWDDNNNQDGKRPEEITVNLLANGTKIKDVTVTASNNWRYSFTNLPKYKAGREIIYTITENRVNSYKTTINGYNITNEYIPEVIEKTVTKKWEDNNNQDGIRPTFVEVQLYKTVQNTKERIDQIRLNSNNNWTYTWDDLPKYEEGKEITYSVSEKVVEHYTPTYSEDTFIITNTYTPNETSKIVVKEWDDNNNQDGIRPATVEVQLYKTIENTKVSIGETVTLNAENAFTYTWANLPLKENGKDIVYSVEEVEVPAGYTVEYSSLDYSETNEITITNIHESATLSKTVIKKWEDNNNQDQIRPTTVEVQLYKTIENKKEFMGDAYKVVLNEENNWTHTWTELPLKEDGKDIVYSVEEVEVPAGYTVEYSSLDYSETNEITITNTHISKKLDLSLRKFITQINEEKYEREPDVDTSTIATTGTATYKHTKKPLIVQKGDIITYTIRVYNEGKVDGYAEKITDYLPDGLLPITEATEGINQEKYAEEIDFNASWGWINSEDGKSITTTVTSKANTDTYSILANIEDVVDTKLEAYVEGSNKLDYIDVKIKCLVANSDAVLIGTNLTNIAEITESQDVNGIKNSDIDSITNNAIIDDLNGYKQEEAINSDLNSYIEGQEDDDDFEKVVLQDYDMALRKFVTKVNETIYLREPKVDASRLGTIVNGKAITTATYIHSKQPVIVETGDVVTYTIRVYNEGSLAGFVNEITDNIPEGLEFLPDSTVNTLYKWEMLDSEGNETTDVSKATIIVTDYLSETDSNNIINAVSELDGVKTLSYKDVQVQFKVTAIAQKLQENIIINEAQISEDNNKDRDSDPNRNEKYNYTSENNEDDIDYEPIKLQYFDLALRKFVTKVNTTDYNNRYPEIIYNEDGSISYNQTKDPVIVTTDDIIIYTIRVYNEGQKSGRAMEITDNLPEGLEFLSDNEINKLYGWKLIDGEGKETDNVIEAKKITTDVLKDEIINGIIEKDGQKVLSYKDVKIAFRVTETETTDKIIVNTAEIVKDSADDVDSVPDNQIETEDDLDKEYIKVQYFDLSLKKWVTETKVTVDGKTTTTKTDFTDDSDEIAKVDIVSKKLKKTTVKFVYNIKVTNEGEIPGYATQIKDYIPSGLEFIQEENEGWEEIEDGIVVNDELKDTLLNPGESATVEITLTWKNSTTNLSLKTNYAEISEDSGNDIDSTPDNFSKHEDDIDDAQVILSIKTAGAHTYVGLVLISVAILAVGIFLIKKYVID